MGTVCCTAPDKGPPEDHGSAPVNVHIKSAKHATEKVQNGAAKNSGPTPHEQRTNVQKKDEREFVETRGIIARVIGRLRGHERQPDEKCDWEYKDPVKEAAAAVNTSGLVLNFPITFADAELLRGHYCKNGGNAPLERRVAEELLTQFTNIFANVHPCSVAEIPNFERELYVVGDTHGQLEDVLHIFHLYGPPSAKCVYIFNGNIADRGANASEIFFLLFAYFLADNKSVIINRGNHEDEHFNALDVSKGGGFQKEVVQKYQSSTYKLFVSAMKVFPLCTSIRCQHHTGTPGTVFVVHGGLATAADTPDWSLTVDFIKTIDHTEFTQPDMKSAVLQDVVWNDLLWSDPREERGSEPSKRGTGIHWGPDITQKFFADTKEKYDIRYIIRSHELPSTEQGKKEGWAFQHFDHVLTVFSASNYCGSSNLGAIAHFVHNERFPTCKIKTFSAPKLEYIANSLGGGVDKLHALPEEWVAEGELVRKEAAQQSEEKYWIEELGKLMVAIVETKPAIHAHFLKIMKGKPLVDKLTWEGIMKAGVGECFHMDRAWVGWKLDATSIGAHHQVNFVDFMRRFRVHIANDEYTSFKYKAIARVFDAVLHEHANLTQTLKRFDKSGKGKIDMNGMREALQQFDLGLSAAQLESLLHIFFEGADESNGDPEISVDAFLVRFAIVYRQAEDAIGLGEQSAEERMQHEAMGQIGHAIALTPLEKLEKHMTAQEKAPAKKGKKKADGDEEPAAVKSGKKTKPKGKVKHNVGAKLKMKVERVFQLMDASNDGFIETEEFVRGISKIPGVMEIKLSDGQLEDDAHLRCLAKALDKGGKISLIEFLGAFCFEDNDGVTDALADHMNGVLFRHRGTIRTACRYFDEQGSGRVKKDEFLLVLQAVNKEIEESGLHFSEAQMDDLCEALAKPHKDGTLLVAYEEFFEAFTIIDSNNLALEATLKSA